jgi:hypothetical protein
MKKILVSASSLLFGISVLTSPFSAFASAVIVQQTVYTGECGADGDNITWTYDTTTQTMTFSGTGTMKNYIEDYNYAEVPEWTCGQVGSVYDAVNVVFEDGITDIGVLPDDVFGSGEKNCTMTIPESVTDFNLTYISKENVTFYVKYGSRAYYGLNNVKMISTGVAESPCYPVSGVTNGGVSWNFDYETSSLWLDGDGTLYSGDLSDIVSGCLQKVKSFRIGKDVKMPESAEDTYNDTIFFIFTLLPSGNAFDYTVYLYEGSEAATAYAESVPYMDEVLVPCKVLSETAVCGDVNLDGVVELTDAVILSKAMANVLTLSDTQKTVADCTGDGTIDDSDVATLMSYLIFLIPSIPTKA